MQERQKDETGAHELDIPATYRQMGHFVRSNADTQGFSIDLVPTPGGDSTYRLLPSISPEVREIQERAGALGWSEADLLQHMRQIYRWPTTAQRLAVLPTDWLHECLAALDKLQYPHQWRDVLRRIDIGVKKRPWTIADAIDHCIQTGHWQREEPGALLAKNSNRIDRLTLKQLHELAVAVYH
jgi:hypothetical protein